MILNVESAIVQRLTQKVADVHIATADQLSEVSERQQVTPALHVIYSGFSPTREIGQGTVQEIESRWTIVIAIRSARRGGTKEKADTLFDSVISAISGFKPTASHAALKLSGSPGAQHVPGFSYYPIQFVTKETVRGNP